jgi:3'-phosphoadenosine 5'-phosphosulfate sulfotransferase (PAPS reductase)/FAD synthetase
MEIKTAPHGGKHFKPRKDRKNVYTYEWLQEKQALSLNDKLAWTHNVVEDALRKMKNPCVAFSAGKDSTVLLHILQKLKPGFPVIYGNTGIEFPECVKFAHWLQKEWHLNFHEAKPETNFWQITKEYGWPLMGKQFGVSGVAHKSSRAKFFAELKSQGKLKGNYAIQAENPISSACCTFLKERPSEKLQKQLGIDGVFLGIMASESRRRMFLCLEYGELYKVKSKKIWKCHPLAIWNDEDIWKYIRSNGLPYASLYDMGYMNEYGRFVKHKRNGCMFCGMDIKYPDNHLSIMRHTHPKAWKVLMLKKGLGRILLDLHISIFKQYDLMNEIMPLEEYIEKFPCAFDRI